MSGGRESGGGAAPPNRRRHLVGLAMFASFCFASGVWVGGSGGGAGTDGASIYKLAQEAVCPPVHCDDARDESDRASSGDAPVPGGRGATEADLEPNPPRQPPCPPQICPRSECPKCQRATCPPCVDAVSRTTAAAATTTSTMPDAEAVDSALTSEVAVCPACDPCPITTTTTKTTEAGKATKHGEKAGAGAPPLADEDEAPSGAITRTPPSAAGVSDAVDEVVRPPANPLPPTLNDADDPPFDWTNIVDDALAPYPSILKNDVHSAEMKVRESVNSFRGQIIGGRLFIRDIRSLQFARDYAPSWKITLLETMRRHRDLPDVDIVFNEGDYPIVQIPKDGAHQQRLYGRGSNGMKPPPVFSPTQSETTMDIPFPDFSFSPPGNKGEDRLNTNRWAAAHARVSAAGRAVPFEKKIPLAAFTGQDAAVLVLQDQQDAAVLVLRRARDPECKGNTQAGPRQKLVEVAKLRPEYVFVNQVFKKSPKGALSCVEEGKADKGGLQEDECALSFEEMCRYRYLVNVGSNGYANKLKYLFLCGSVVITVRDGMPNREFFERQLLPGVHYVAVEEAKDVPAAVEMLEGNPRVAANIAARGTRRMARFDMDAVTGYVAHLIRAYAKRQRFDVVRLENTLEVRCEDDLYHHYDHNDTLYVLLRRGGLKKYITNDSSTCLAPPGGEAADGAASDERDRVPIPCDVAFDLKEVPDACPGMKWPGWGKRCKVMECAEWMPDAPPPPPLKPPSPALKPPSPPPTPATPPQPASTAGFRV